MSDDPKQRDDEKPDRLEESEDQRESEGSGDAGAPLPDKKSEDDDDGMELEQVLKRLKRQD